jgi:hypothetical protein
VIVDMSECRPELLRYIITVPIEVSCTHYAGIAGTINFEFLIAGYSVCVCFRYETGIFVDDEDGSHRGKK